MFIQGKIEDAAAKIISASFATNGVTGWSIYKGLDFNKVVMPCVLVVCSDYEPAYRELNIGVGKATLEITTVAYKTATSGSVFESVSDFVFNPFLLDSCAGTFSSNTTNLKVFTISENGLDVTTLEDGWAALQKFEIVCGRTA